MASIADLLFAFAQWLKSTPLLEFSVWFSNTPLSQALGKTFWAIPTIQTIHILAVAMTFGSVALINLRIFQLAGRSRSMTQTVARYGPWVWWGLLVLLATGLCLVIAEPTRELLNPCFWTKMALVVVAALIALWFQRSVRRDGERWSLTHNGRLGIRIGSGAVVGLWLVIMVFGRWIAYAPT
jgi:uncharacterized membrane protein SirB2